ncbi:MAG: acyl-CoA dehydrogenase family protein [Candidatus Firestonebacteria bacterium]
MKVFEKYGFLKSLVTGRLKKELLIPYPEDNEQEKEIMNVFLDSLKKFASGKIDGEKIDHDAKIPQDVIDGLKNLGVFGMTIPEQYGGSGLSQTAYNHAMEIIASYCASTATFIGAHQSIGMKAILLFGTEEQKNKFLPQLATGEKIACFALTEPSAGCDVHNIQTKAVLTEDGNYYILNGSKHFITNGSIADVFTIFAKTEVIDKGEKKNKITAFIVTKDMPGITIGKDEDKMGIKGSVTTAFNLDNVKIPKENVLGEPGEGFHIAMMILNYGRLGLGAGCLGVAKKLIKLSSKYATEREQFGQPIKNFEMIKDKISQMSVKTYAMESLLDVTAKTADKYPAMDFSLESATCKVFSAEALWSIVNHSMQIAGGYGYIKEYPYERFLRDARINIIFEGTSEILRLFIALEGAREIGKELKHGGILKYILKKIRNIFVTEELDGVDFILKKETLNIAKFTKLFQNKFEGIVMKYKKELIHKEFVQQKIADIIINLYAAYCTIARTQHIILKKTVAESQVEINICKVFCNDAFNIISDNLKNLDINDDKRKVLISDAIVDQKYKF